MSKRDLKLIAATLTVVGVVLSIFDKIFEPHYIADTYTPTWPDFLRWVGWGFLLIPPLIYIWLDRENLFPKKKDKKEKDKLDISEIY